MVNKKQFFDMFEVRWLADIRDEDEDSELIIRPKQAIAVPTKIGNDAIWRCIKNSFSPKRLVETIKKMEKLKENNEYLELELGLESGFTVMLKLKEK